MSRRNKIGLLMVIGGLVVLLVGTVLLILHFNHEFGELWMGVVLMALAFVLILGSPLENQQDQRKRYLSEVKTP